MSRWACGGVTGQKYPELVTMAATEMMNMNHIDWEAVQAE
jgi:hypothetical protein